MQSVHVDRQVDGLPGRVAQTLADAEEQLLAFDFHAEELIGPDRQHRGHTAADAAPSRRLATLIDILGAKADTDIASVEPVEAGCQGRRDQEIELPAPEAQLLAVCEQARPSNSLSADC